MDSISLKALHAKLVSKRSELLSALQNRDEIKIEGRAADHLDEALASSARAVAVERVNRDMVTLRLVEAAINRVIHGEFGECADCGESIPEVRLNVVPWTERCVSCQHEYDEQNKRVETPQFLRRFNR